MQLLPIDLTEIIAVFMGISIVLIPVIGLTARFALKPFVDALTRGLEARGHDEAVQILERRVALLESQLESVEHSVLRIEDVAEFDSQLRQASSSDAGKLPSS